MKPKKQLVKAIPEPVFKVQRGMTLRKHDVMHLSHVADALKSVLDLMWGIPVELDPTGIGYLLEPHVQLLSEIAKRVAAAEEAAEAEELWPKGVR